MIEYHASSAFYDHVHHNVVGAVIEDAVYAPLYYGYGGKESGAPGRSPEGQRTTYARVTESRIMKRCPNVVLVLMKASPEVIRGRRRENPTVEPGEPTRGVVKAEDVEFVLKRFEEEFDAALIENKITLDTTSATEEETLAEFVEKHEPFMTEGDRERIGKHQAGSRADRKTPSRQQSAIAQRSDGMRDGDRSTRRRGFRGDGSTQNGRLFKPGRLQACRPGRPQP
jgi:hypothetical protein